MAMDIEGFVEAPGRADMVRQVRAKIDQLGIEYLYLQFVSVTGRICGKGIPADHWESIAERGFQLVYGATVNLFLNRHGEYLGYGPQDKELVGIPEPETFCQLPWDKRVARLWCTLFRNREERQDPGAFLTSDCRGNLRRIHEQFKAEHDGLHLRHGTEPEMMWLKRGADGKPDGGFSNPYCYHIDQFESLRPVYLRAIEYSRAMGLDMIQGDHEDAPGQLELNFTFDDPPAHRGPAHHLPPDLRPGRARVQPHRVLHVEAVHGRVGVGLPPQHQLLARRRRVGQDPRAGLRRAAGHGDQLHLPVRRREHLHARHRRPADAGQGRPAGRRRHRHASRGADRDRLLHRQLVPAAVGHGVLGAGVRGLGLPEPHHGSSHLGPRAVRVPRGRLHGQSAPDGRRESSRRPRTASATTSTPARRRTATSTRRWRPASRSSGCR